MRVCRLASFILLVAAGHVAAQSPVDASWIWSDEGSLESAPKGTVWFRREVKVDQPSTCQVRIAADDSFTLWVNGKKIGEGKAGKSHRFNLNGIVEEGINVFALAATNDDGRAGLLLDGVVRGQGGDETPIDSGPAWMVSKRAPAGDAWMKPRFQAANWAPAKELGKHDASPWKEISFAETYLDRYWLGPGLEIERIAEPDLAGSIVNMAWGPKGTLFVSKERGPIIVIKDTNSDGKYDAAHNYSDKMKDAQGLLWLGQELYAVGEGPLGAGLYRLPDADQDQKADEIKLLHKHKGGMGEHGPHAVILGPDGWLYHVTGNHAWVSAKPEPASPARQYTEAYLLEPKFEDGRGHASGIKAPGGSIWRLSRDGKKWWIETNGFRNAYDIVFNSDGELFAFDSDMEWDIGEPWYRPVRVNHCTSGAEFGWRSGAAKWPEDYLDSLGSMADVGRGSPTGITVYEHTALPKQYRNSLLVCDWSMGRILSVPMTPQGASYDGSKTTTLITGNPLNVSDIEIAPDGSIVFSTGGRMTEGGVYRIRATGQEAKAPKAETVADLMSVPQLDSTWGRELASSVQAKDKEAWKRELESLVEKGPADHKVRALMLLHQLGPAPAPGLIIAASKDKDARVRAFATWLLGNHNSPECVQALTERLKDENKRVQRRACEAFVRSGQEAPVEPLVALLGDEDRYLRFAARLALERVPVEKWKSAIVAAESDRARVHGLLGLLRCGESAIAPNEVLVQVVSMLQKESDQKIELLRLAQLAILAGASGPGTEMLGEFLVKKIPSSNRRFDMEASRLLARLGTPSATPLLMSLLERESSQQMQVHYALCLSYLNAGWNSELKSRYIAWYEKSKDLDGGHSFVPYLENIVSATFPRLTPDERRDLLSRWKEHPYATRLLLLRNNPDEVTNFSTVVESILAETNSGAGPYASELFDLSIDALGRSKKPECQAILRKLFDDNPDRREKIASKLSENPTPENRPYLIRSLLFAGDSTLQFVLRGLARLETKPEKPDDVRQVIIAGLKLENAGGKVAVDLLRDWTGEKAPTDDVVQSLAFYQEWFSKKHPDQPKAELPKAASADEKYTFDQLLNYLEKDPKGRAGDPERGKAAYAKALCAKCHKFGSDGTGIGPDLTTLRRRFQRKEIVEAIVYPSQVVSDQYRTVTVLTQDGLVQNGMLAEQKGQESVVLWLNNGERVEIPKGDIDEQRPSPLSLMPPGLLKDLSLEEIADLFAYLETSKTNPEPQPMARAGGGK